MPETQPDTIQDRSFGLTPKERLAWTKHQIVYILNEHAMFDPVGEPSKDGTPRLAETHRYIEDEIGMFHLVNFISDRIFKDADEEERLFLSERMLPGSHATIAPVVIRAARLAEIQPFTLRPQIGTDAVEMVRDTTLSDPPREYHDDEPAFLLGLGPLTIDDSHPLTGHPKTDEVAGPLIYEIMKDHVEKHHSLPTKAIDAAFSAARKHHLLMWLNPFLQDEAKGQRGLGRFVRTKLSSSSPNSISSMIRMRRHAIDHRVLWKEVKDDPRPIAEFYTKSILGSIGDVNSLPQHVWLVVSHMVARGTPSESIRNMLEAILASKDKEGFQTIPPSDKEINGIKFSVVPKVSPLVLSAGDINGSCMTWGGAGGSCVEDILVNPRAALLVFGHDKPFGYSYLRHGNSGTLYLDNVEVSDEGRADPNLGEAMAQWIKVTMDEIRSTVAMIGKMHSPPSLFNGVQGVCDDRLDESVEAAEFGEEAKDIYSDLFGKVWKIER